MKTSRFALLLLLTFLVVTPVGLGQGAGVGSGTSPKIKLSGRVVDSKGTALSSVMVGVQLRCKCSTCSDPTTCPCCPGQISLKTDRFGKFDLSVAPGTYKVTAHKKEMTVVVKAGAANKFDIPVQ
jgi:hypothetical protein